VVMCQVAASRASNKELFDSMAEHWQRRQAAVKGRELDG
jgi:hypothetical protein